MALNSFSLTLSMLVVLFLTFDNTKAANLPNDMVDLTYRFTNSTPYWPGVQNFQLVRAHRGPFGGAPWVEMNAYSANEHGGTHMDAPSHFIEGGWNIDDIPVTRFIGPALVLDVSDQSAKDPDYLATVEDIVSWEKEYGQIEDGSILILKTGWYKLWPDTLTYFGNGTDLHFPGFHADLAQWLVDNRNIHGVGIDTASIDHGPSTTFMAHRILLGKNLFALENLGHLDKVPARGSTLYALPMNIEGGTGAPCRVLAMKGGPVNSALRVSYAGLQGFIFVSVIVGLASFM